MPHYQLMTSKVNVKFGPAEIANTARQREVLRGEAFTLSAAATALNMDITSAEAAFIDALPHAIQMSIKAALFCALDRTPPIPVQMLWLPGGGYEVTVNEAIGVNKATTAVSILIRTPYQLPDSGPGSLPPAQ